MLSSYLNNAYNSIACEQKRYRIQQSCFQYIHYIIIICTYCACILAMKRIFVGFIKVGGSKAN